MTISIPLKTVGRPQEIVAGAVRRGETVDAIFLSWLWHDFQQLQAEVVRLRPEAVFVYPEESEQDGGHVRGFETEGAT